MTTAQVIMTIKVTDSVSLPVLRDAIRRFVEDCPFGEVKVTKVELVLGEADGSNNPVQDVRSDLHHAGP